MIVLMCVFLVNDTGTTGMYSDLHTLPLHESLPVLVRAGEPVAHRTLDRRMARRRRRSDRPARTVRQPDTGAPARHRRSRARRARASARRRPRFTVRGARGRDHERDRKSTRLKLQSLMRISYAVFCLKKKNKTQNQLTTYT